MQSIVTTLISVVDFDAVLGEDSEDVAMAASSCNPKRIQSFFILSIDLNHLIFEEESHETLTDHRDRQLLLAFRAIKTTYCPLVAAIFKGNPERPVKLIS